MKDKGKTGDQSNPRVLEKNSAMYKLVRDAINNEKKEGFTSADIKDVNPQLAAFMEENNIVKAKINKDLIEKSDLSAEDMQTLVALADQIKKEHTKD